MEIHDLGEFLNYFENVRRRTSKLADCIPEQQIEWRPRADGFSIGDTLRHIAATERWMFAENVAGRPSRYPGHGSELASGLTGVLDYLERMHAESIEIIGAIEPNQLRMTCEVPGGAKIPRWKWLRAMIEHEAHHRGQIYLMLGMLNVATPPLYGLTSEQVRAFSVE